MGVQRPLPRGTQPIQPCNNQRGGFCLPPSSWGFIVGGTGIGGGCNRALGFQAGSEQGIQGFTSDLFHMEG